MQLWRSTTAAQWEEVAELIDPPSRNTFLYQNFNFPGVKKTDRQIDATGMMALVKFKAICDSLLTPRNSFWHKLEADDDYVMKDRATKLWFEKATKTLFKLRYAPLSNFTAQNQGQYHSLGAYGTGALFVDEYDGSEFGGSKRGIRYKSIPMGEMFIRENHQGICNGGIRWFKHDAQQAHERWKNTGNLPQAIWTALEQGTKWPFNFLHVIRPNDEYDPERLDYRGMPWSSFYISIEGKCLLSEGGYRTLPIIVSRYEQTPGEVYGRSPAMMVLPSLKTLNNEKSVFLKQGHRAGDPVLLTTDDGVVDFNFRPGSMNKGGMSADGKPLVGTLPTGDINLNEKMMGMEVSLINDAFLVALFQILTETPQMTATEVIERVNEKGILLAPTIGRQSSEYLGPLIDREIDLASWMGLLDPMPPRLQEAKGEYKVRFTSPMAKAAQAQEAAGFYRVLEVVKEMVNITQDPSLLDPFDFDVAIPAISDIQGVPESWMADDKKIDAKRKNRAAAQREKMRVDALPSEAAMVKAKAVAAKAGQPQQEPDQDDQQQQQPRQIQLRGGLGQPGGIGG